MRCTKIWISHSLVDLEHWGKHETLLIRKAPGVLDKKNAFTWEAGGQRKEEETRWAQRELPSKQEHTIPKFPQPRWSSVFPSDHLLQGLMISYVLILSCFNFSLLSATCAQDINMLWILPFEHSSSISCAVLYNRCCPDKPRTEHSTFFASTSTFPFILKLTFKIVIKVIHIWS